MSEGRIVPLAESLRLNVGGDVPLDQMHCPVCGDPNVHFALGHVENTDGYTCPLPGVRGSWVAMDFHCEPCDHRWRLVVGEHKGETFAGNMLAESTPPGDAGAV